MSLGDPQPFVGSQAYYKVNSAYVSFPSQVDAMLASLQRRPVSLHGSLLICHKSPGL